MLLKIIELELHLLLRPLPLGGHHLLPLFLQPFGHGVVNRLFTLGEGFLPLTGLVQALLQIFLLLNKFGLKLTAELLPDGFRENIADFKFSTTTGACHELFRHNLP